MLPAIRALRNALRLLTPVLVLACVLLPSARAESTDSALPTPTLASQERQLEAWRAEYVASRIRPMITLAAIDGSPVEVGLDEAGDPVLIAQLPRRQVTTSVSR